MKWSVIGLFGMVVNNAIELFSDWLFHSVAQCWALLWLAVSQCGSMLSSALIGCFTVSALCELCSDWLFHSVAQCWALLWLAVSQCGSMLSSALIGCFTVWLNVELCSDWLFHRASSHSKKKTQGGNIFTFMHLADAFIQSDLQGMIFFVSMCISGELNPQRFVLVTHCSTTEPQGQYIYFNTFSRSYIVG